MNRPLLSFLSVALLCAPGCYALAADSTTSATAEQQVRQQVEAQRDQLSGAANIGHAKQTGASAVIDAPVDTDDAPTQGQRP
ncbi:hypothetical protein ALQ18_04398 [Pseudomonas marginalis pv. marginalis]|nr:hypothetical protein ALQ18_04398 [Pseudomonas marginalis pv. marginalis]